MSTVLFEDLNLNPQILRAIKEMGFEEATPIQAQSIPAVMSGRDVIGLVPKRYIGMCTDRNRKNGILRYSVASQSGSETEENAGTDLMPDP